MSVHEDAIEALLVDGNQHNYCWWVDMLEGEGDEKAMDLAFDARAVVEDLLNFDCSYADVSLEAAQLLLEGWHPGQKVVLL